MFFLFLLRSITNSNQEQSISLISIIIYKASYKIRLSGYVVLIQENKQRTYSLSQSMKYYLSIYLENDLNGDLKSETYSSTRRSTRIKTNNLFGKSGSLYFETPQKMF